jgi:hypothetical protein
MGTDHTESNRATDAQRASESDEQLIELSLEDLAQVGGGIIKHGPVVPDRIGKV